MFQTQQVVKESNKARVTYNAILQKGKELGLDETAEVESVPGQNTTKGVGVRRWQVYSVHSKFMFV
jgi:hypothetical protein